MSVLSKQLKRRKQFQMHFTKLAYQKQIRTLQENYSPISLTMASQMVLEVKEPTCQCRRHVRDTVLTPRLGRSSGGGHGNPLPYSCQRIPWTTDPRGLYSIGSQSQARLKNLACTHASLKNTDVQIPNKTLAN